MSRKSDLEAHIRESYTLIREYEELLRLSSDPKEQARARRAIDEQWTLIQDYLVERRRIDEDLPADVAEIAVHFEGEVGVPPAARAELREDPYACYERGLEQLLQHMGKDHPRYSEALIYQQRLTENITEARVYGETDTNEVERRKVIHRLNELTLAILGVSFNELCEPEEAVGLLEVPAEEKPPAELYREKLLETLLEGRLEAAQEDLRGLRQRLGPQEVQAAEEGVQDEAAGRLLARGEELEGDGRPEEAAACYRRVLEIRPAGPEAAHVSQKLQEWLQRAREWEAGEGETEALWWCRLVLQVEPGHQKARAGKERLYLATLPRTAEGWVITGPEDVTELLALPEPPTQIWWEKARMELVLVPAGEFLMGSADDDPEALDAEQPRHTVYLSAYYIGRCPVTNAQYARFVRETGQQVPPHWSRAEPPPGREDHPVVNILWNDAAEFCQWADLRLPAEAQWEKAARGTDGRMYPWGTAWDPGRCNTCESGLNGTAAVGHYSPDGDSPYGCADMAGNVWEWCADWYDEQYYRRSPTEDPRGPEEGRLRVLRGGSWLEPPRCARCAHRNGRDPDAWGNDIGFRVVLDSARGGSR